MKYNTLLNALDMALFYRVGPCPGSNDFTKRVCEIRGAPESLQGDKIVALLQEMEAGCHMTENGDPLIDPEKTDWPERESDSLLKNFPDLAEKVAEKRAT